MKIISNILVGILFIIFSTFSSSALAQSTSTEVIHWSSWNQDFLNSKTTINKPIFLFIHASWCHWCKAMKETTFKDPRIINTINSDFTPIEADADTNVELLKTYQIVNIPTILIMDNINHVYKTLSGYITTDDLLKELKLDLSTFKLKYNKLQNIEITIIGKSNDPAMNNLINTAKTYKDHGVKINIFDVLNKNVTIDKKYPVLDKSAAYICSANKCSFPLFNALDLNSMIERITNTQQPVNLSPDTTAKIRFQVDTLLEKENIFLTLLSFYGFGILLAFTPCMLPLIIIMAGIIGGRMGSIPKSKIINLAIIYVLSLASTYAFAGLIAAFFGLYIQAYFQAKWILISFSVIFALLALSLLGFYSIKLPPSWSHRIARFNKLESDYSYIHVAIMGILATLIASPCAAAPLLAVLSYVAKTGDIALSSLSLFVVGLGVGSPLLVASIVGTNILPNNKSFQHALKLFFGFVLMGVAIWLLNHIISPWLTMILWSILVLYLSVMMQGYVFPTQGNAQRIWDVLHLTTLIFGISIFIGALIGNTNPLNPLSLKIFTSVQKNYIDTNFQNITDLTQFNKQLTVANLSNKPVLLMFTANWCEACHQIESIFESPELSQLLNKFVLLRINIGSDKDIALAKTFNVIAPPEILLFDSQGRKLDIHLPVIINEDSIKDMLQAGINANQLSRD